MDDALHLSRMLAADGNTSHCITHVITCDNFNLEYRGEKQQRLLATKQTNILPKSYEDINLPENNRSVLHIFEKMWHIPLVIMFSILDWLMIVDRRSIGGHFI